MRIPSAKDSDPEDVVWGLQTAEALWKRGERIDALVWLRRAAQAAGDTSDDDRALELARVAAELTDWMANAPSGMPPPPSSVNAEVAIATTPTPVVEAPLDRMSIDVMVDIEESRPALPPIAPPSGANMHAFDAPAHPSTTDVIAGPVSPAEESDAAATDEADGLGDRRSASVPPAEKVHAGMFDPWAESQAQMAASAPLLPRPRIEEDGHEEEVITSVRPQGSIPVPYSSVPPAARSAPAPARSAPAPAPSSPNLSSPSSPNIGKPPAKPPPLPPRARMRSVADAPSSPSVKVPAAAPSAPAPPRIPSMRPLETMNEEPTPVVHVPAALAAIRGQDVGVAPEKLDLNDSESFADLPDDARERFAAQAKIETLAENEEVSNFALAYVVTGAVDVAATMVDAPAVRLVTGAVLRSRGTTDEGVPMRLICAPPKAVIATWSETDVEDAFRTCPWVEEDLRAAADRVQTLVGITIGPLGERLDGSIREQVVGRLTMKTLIAGDIVVKAGELVPGLLLVGVGELELVRDDKVEGTVGSGEFLFPGEVLGAGSAPMTARAGAGGALILLGDRGIRSEERR